MVLVLVNQVEFVGQHLPSDLGSDVLVDVPIDYGVLVGHFGLVDHNRLFRHNRLVRYSSVVVRVLWRDSWGCGDHSLNFLVKRFLEDLFEFLEIEF